MLTIVNKTESVGSPNLYEQRGKENVARLVPSLKRADKLVNTVTSIGLANESSWISRSRYLI